MEFNFIKKIFRYIFVDYKSFVLEHRLLISAIIAGIIISLLGSVFSIIISSSVTVIITSVTLFLTLLMLYYFVRIKKKFTSFVFPIITVSILGISIIWIFDGGINGSNLYPGFVILVLSLIVVPYNKSKYVILLFIASIIIIYLIQLYRPDLIVNFSSEKIRWIDSIVTVIYSAILIFFIIRFLHENYTLEKQRAEENSNQLKKLNTTKDKLFSVIAHDLRSPFNGILGFSDLLIENLTNLDVEKSKKYLGLINSSAKNTLILLDNLLNWAKSQTGQIIIKPEKIILSEVISEIINQSNTIAHIKNISLTYEPSETIDVFTDKDLIMIVIRNLISNAIKFTKTGGNVTVFATLESNKVNITISDDGIGMSEETREKLFDISTNITSQGTANEKGSGLGLVLCHEIIKLLGGEIWIESEEGKGSDFIFTLPLKKAHNKVQIS